MEVLSPNTEILDVANHSNVVLIELVSVWATEDPEQIVLVAALVITGKGFTVMVTTLLSIEQALLFNKLVVVNL